MAQSKDEQEEVTMGQRQGVTQPRCSLPCQDNSFSADKAQASSKTLRGSFDDLDIPYIDEDEESSWVVMIKTFWTFFSQKICQRDRRPLHFDL